MKRFTNLFVALGVTLFLFTIGMKSEAEGQPCTTLLDTLTIAGCPYEFEICVYCGLSYPGYVKVMGYRKLDPNCINALTDVQLIQQALTQLNSPSSLWLEFCQPFVPPCDEEARKVVTWQIPMCVNARLYGIVPPNPPAFPDVRYEYYIRSCSDSYCSIEYEYCRDEFGVIHYNVNSYTPTTGTLGCSLEGWQVELPTEEIGETSDCYIIHTPCNP